MPEVPIVIVGGGAAGLSTAGALKHVGLDAVVLDKERQLGGTWARRYDRLHLHHPPALGAGALPHPRDLPTFLARDQFVAYLRDYARHFSLQIVGGCPVRKVRATGDGDRPGWLVESDCGTWRCRAVVIAAGHYNIRCCPAGPARATIGGRWHTRSSTAAGSPTPASASW